MERDNILRPDDSVDTIKGIGDKTRSLFEKLDVNTVGELLTFYPREYETFSYPVKIKELVPGRVGAVEASLSNIKSIRKGNLDLLTCTAKDSTGIVDLAWYNQSYLKSSLSVAYHYIIRGKVVKKGKFLRFEQPKLYKREEYLSLMKTLSPIYPLTAGLTNNAVKKAVKQALVLAEDVPEYIPADIRKKYKLLKKGTCLNEVHFPKSEETLCDAKKTLIFEEFFLFALFLREMSGKKETLKSPHIFKNDEICNKFIAGLPFELTRDQMNTFEDIKKDTSSGRVMVRLIQGDVGSGKTVIAELAALLATASGAQACVMVPTEVLANQHYEDFKKSLEPLGVKVDILTGSLKASDKKGARKRAEEGETDILIGTQALIQDSVAFKNLGLVVTDEQHRFGVNQRLTLSDKGNIPHVLVMSATPIPRTLAMMLYGDMDISVIKEMPKGRLPIKNAVVGAGYHEAAYKHIERELSAGHQAYVICPMVEASELLDAKDVTSYKDELADRFKGYEVEMLHGRMTPAQKDEIMGRFASGEVKLLVSTTVIEVGVNVPNATVMMIENSERFGLAQLHQLRGRVGRGNAQSYCIFFYEGNDENTKERLNVIGNSNDGFFIASEDMRLRGPGDMFLGLRQSGEFELKVGDIFRDADILKLATEEANALSDSKRSEILEETLRNGGKTMFAFFKAYASI
ncbi:MAG: ATP-dependent DNA helicase RecG [Lachnospiraceae bacterium]|nr:ATP-dependent DNA helicase RecG [Lachnospiraceae bacterium]